MNYTKKIFCLVLTGLLLLSAGCQKDKSSSQPAETTAPAVEIKAEIGQEAAYGGMHMTLISAEDPDITMDSGKSAIFFQVKIDNFTEETIAANWLNNFSLTVDGTEYASDECCTLPVMGKLYDFYGIDALNEEIPAGESRTGYIACEAEKGFQELSLHYTPKTTDRTSRITVPVTAEQIVKAEKNS